jgi:hypothetical protein
MRRLLTPRAVKDYEQAPFGARRAFDKQSALLAKNLRHPSLCAKKYDEASGLWQARVNGSWRFYFLINGDIYTIVTIVRHPK